MRPDSRLLEQLVVARYRLNRAQASVGVGERRSQNKGAGMEFAAHRPYREGDDVRNLDPRLLARLGEPFVREYFVDRQLPVYVLLDGSASMLTGEPQKYRFGAVLAQVLGFIALASGDRVQLGVSGGKRVDWSPQLQGQSRAEMLFDWLGKRPTGGRTPFSQALAQARSEMKPRAMVVLVGDFMDEGVDAQFKLLAGARHDIVAIHLASPQEIDPAALGSGPVRLSDAENGEALDLSLNPAVLERYRAAFAQWRSRLEQTISRGGAGQYFFLPTSGDINSFVGLELRRRYVIS
ncbi:DUF58 domain-containing protein [Devosia sp. 1566]|uniref:DUF58 domain-containing protein n=1 Tax=Devosia sp. 1566 TaxID=2499144 RepID=UPI000FDAD577|nr:DUF58 domain-containing protein [Devosia sp. 1566]